MVLSLLIKIMVRKLTPLVSYHALVNAFWLLTILT